MVPNCPKIVFRIWLLPGELLLLHLLNGVFFEDNLGKPAAKVNHSGFFWSKR